MGVAPLIDDIPINTVISRLHRKIYSQVCLIPTRRIEGSVSSLYYVFVSIYPHYQGILDLSKDHLKQRLHQ